MEKLMKKVLVLILGALLIFGLASCEDASGDTSDSGTFTITSLVKGEPGDYDDFDDDDSMDSGYGDFSFILTGSSSYPELTIYIPYISDPGDLVVPPNGNYDLEDYEADCTYITTNFEIYVPVSGNLTIENSDSTTGTYTVTISGNFWEFDISGNLNSTSNNFSGTVNVSN